MDGEGLFLQLTFLKSFSELKHLRTLVFSLSCQPKSYYSRVGVLSVFLQKESVANWNDFELDNKHIYDNVK